MTAYSEPLLWTGPRRDDSLSLIQRYLPVALPARERYPLSRTGVAGEMMNAKRKAILDRIASLEEAIHRAKEFLATGKHADWHKFRPLFDHKLKEGKEAPPHKDWVKNVFLRRAERALAQTEKLLPRVSEPKRVRVRDNQALQRTGRAERPL
jgi:hypothetical protein